MPIKLLAIGTKMPAWVNTAYQDYAKRMPPEHRLELTEIPSLKRNKNSDLNKIMELESEQLLTQAEGSDHLIALDRLGRAVSTLELAEALAKWRQIGQNVSILIGGPEGISQDVLKKAHERWSLSCLTLPHALVRVLIAEQLYRASSILNHHPYHR